MSIVHHMKAWWHWGEEGAVAIYKFKMTFFLIFQVIVFIVAYELSPHPGWSVIALLVIPHTVLSFRRAIIFTETEVIHRPTLLPLRRVRFEEISSFKKGPAHLPIGFVDAHPAPGVVLTLKDGRRLEFPMHGKDRPEILKRLTEATGKTSDPPTVWSP